MSQRIAQLEELILKHQALYYGGEAEISDAEFDLLWDELKSLAPNSEVLARVGTTRDAEHSVDGFPKAQHLIPMGSQDKAANPQEFLAWAKKIGLQEQKNASLTSEKDRLTKNVVVQYKLDGASLGLQYEKGVLTRAVTRGDGIKGDDITANARRMKGIVQKIDASFSGGVRGEVIMTHDVWKEKYKDKANCRNAANGLMRRKDGQGCEDLTFTAFDASVPNNDAYFKDEVQKLQWLTSYGFEVTEAKVFSDAQNIIEYRNEVSGIREKLPFDIDGLVVKDIEIDMIDLKRARPEKQIAFKFELETAFSILREVEWSESGATYTPIGIVDPVRLAGTTVKRANLNNPDMIRAMGLKIGCAVTVVKRGEIIPKIEGLAPDGALTLNEKLKEIDFPKICGECNTTLTDAGTRLFCPNTECPKRLLQRLEKWVMVLDIRELGEKLIRQLFEKGRVRHIHELYDLKIEELSEYDRMAETSAAKVIRHIQTKRELSLAAFVAGFNIEGIAEATMEKIAAAGFDTLELLRTAKAQELALIHGLGEITANVITEGLIECKADMDAVLKTNVISIKAPPKADSLPLKGFSFCFTGELKKMKRSEAEAKIKSMGAFAKSSVVKGLSYLVTNDPASGSSKNKKANELGIPIIDEDEFLRIVSGQVSGQATKQGEPAQEPAQGELF